MQIVFPLLLSVTLGQTWLIFQKDKLEKNTEVANKHLKKIFQ